MATSNKLERQTLAPVCLSDLHDDGGQVGASAGIAGQLDPVQVDAVPQSLVQCELPAVGKERKIIHVRSVAEPKLFIFGSGSDFGHNFGSGSSSSYNHILALKTVLKH